MPFHNTSDFSHVLKSNLGELWNGLSQPMGTRVDRIILDQNSDPNGPNLCVLGALTAFRSCLQGHRR